MKKNKNSKNVKTIPTKNYIKLAIIFIITLIVVFYANTWYRNYKVERLNTPYIVDKLNTINYTELDNYIIENPNLIIYVGKNNSNECYEFEKDLYKILKDNDLIDESIFLDLSNNYSKELLKELQTKYYDDSLNANLNGVPSLLIMQNKEIKDILTKENDEQITEDKIIQIFEEFEYIK